MLHKEINKASTIVDDLAVNDHLCVLNASDHRTGTAEIDLYVCEAHEPDLSGNLRDAGQELLDIRRRPAMAAMHKPVSQKRSQDRDIAALNRARNSVRDVSDLVDLAEGGAWFRL